MVYCVLIKMKINICMLAFICKLHFAFAFIIGLSNQEYCNYPMPVMKTLFVITTHTDLQFLNMVKHSDANGRLVEDGDEQVCFGH